MTSKTAIPQQANVGQEIGAGIKKKMNVVAEKRNRRALDDIGNSLVTFEGPDGKPIPKNRPNTRSFRAQLLANAEVNAAELKNKIKPFYEERAKVAPRLPKVDAKNKKSSLKPENPIIINLDTEEKPVEKQTDFLNLTTVLAARSRSAAGITKKKPEPLFENIDAGDENDELAVVEYIEDIYKYYFDAEGEHKIGDYMNHQVSINQSIRAIVVDWLIDAHSRFDLAKPTLYLTVNLVDRFLCSMIIGSPIQLQLVGLSAMLIATKYEEIWGPSIDDLVSVAGFRCTNQEVLRMEKLILKKLNWCLTLPTQYMFLVRFIKACLSDQEMESMVYFFAELGMMYYATTQYMPSKVAASAVYAARWTLEKVPIWNYTLKKYTGYEESDLMECARRLVRYHCLASAENSTLRVVFKKYSNSVNHKVALRRPVKFSLGTGDR